VCNDLLSLKEPALVALHPERNDRLNIAITSVFPSAVFVQISNSLAVGQIRPRGVDEVEIVQMMLGYEDDPPEMTLHRLRQANLVGLAGLVSMEDGEAIELAHRASKADLDRSSVIELGGGGEISDRDYRVNDVPLRGFWSYYAELMGVEPEGGCDERRPCGRLGPVGRLRRADRCGKVRMAGPVRRGVSLPSDAAREFRPRPTDGSHSATAARCSKTTSRRCARRTNTISTPTATSSACRASWSRGASSRRRSRSGERNSRRSGARAGRSGIGADLPLLGRSTNEEDCPRLCENLAWVKIFRGHSVGAGGEALRRR
jgi:hypothetical protein